MKIFYISNPLHINKPSREPNHQLQLLDMTSYLLPTAGYNYHNMMPLIPTVDYNYYTWYHIRYFVLFINLILGILSLQAFVLPNKLTKHKFMKKVLVRNEKKKKNKKTRNWYTYLYTSFIFLWASRSRFHFWKIHIPTRKRRLAS